MKKHTAKLSPVHVRLWESDLAFIRQQYPDNYNAQIRRIVGNWVIRHKPETKEDDS